MPSPEFWSYYRYQYPEYVGLQFVVRLIDYRGEGYDVVCPCMMPYPEYAHFEPDLYRREDWYTYRQQPYTPLAPIAAWEVLTLTPSGNL